MEKKIPYLVFASLVILSLGLLTSISLMAGFHLLMIPAILFYFKKYNWRKFPKSGWALLSLCLVLILSVLANHNFIDKPMKNILKVKYYLIGALSIIPLDAYFNHYLKPEKRDRVLKTLWVILLISSSLATLSGLVGYFTGFNPLRMVKVQSERNGGVFGMLMTYGHSIAWLSVFLLASCFNLKKLERIISPRWLLSATFISLIGLFTSHVRGAWIAFFAGCSFINKKITALLLGLCLLGILGAQMHNPKFFETQILRKTSNEERVGSWLAAVKAFEERPVLGYGYLNFEPHSVEIKERYHLPAAYFGGHAHNDVLEILATSGALGVVCFILWISFWILEILRRKDLGTKLTLPFIVAFLASGLTQVTFNDGENAFFLMIVYALSVVL